MRRLSVSLLAFCLTVSLAQATRYHVATNGNDAASGLDWAAALRTPGAALALAQDNDTVMLADGQFTNAYNLVLDKAITLTSTNGSAFTTLNAMSVINRRVISMTAPEAVIEHLTIRGGSTNGNGAGILMTAGTVRHCIVSNNNAYYYGANVWMGNGLVSNCVLTAGIAGYNGGCGVTLTNGLVVDCLIYKNTAGRAGGGVYQSGGIVRNCVIRDNTASSWSGGGVALTGGLMENCLITGNTGGSYPAGTGGGGVYQTGGTLQFCTLGDNGSVVSGGGLYASAGAILNCIIYRNRLLDSGKAESLVLAGTAVASNSCAPELSAASGNTSLFPEWQDSGSRPYDLRPGSPCLDSAQVIASVTQDLVGEARPLDGNGDATAAPDMGCYEMNPAGAFRGNLIASVLLADYEATPTITAYACGSSASGLYYRWDPDGDGDIDAEGGAEVRSISRTYAPGLYTLNLSISNGAGEVVLVNRPNYIRVRGANTFVRTNGPHLNPYATWETASTNIQQAVDMTAPGGAVVISNGVYKLADPLALAKPVTVTGVTNPALPILERAATGTRLIGITDPGVTVENLVVRNGSAPTAADTGGGIYMTGGLVRNCLFTNNTAIFGGGVYMTAGMVSNCLFIKNPTKSGGGASGRGGAVYMNGGTLSDSRILNNTSVRAGAGVLINGGKMERCFVYGNNAGHGGGGVAMEGAATLENCLIVSNMSGSVSGGGGGVLMLAAGRIVHCTVVSNRTTTVGLGGGIYRGSAVNGVVTNTIIWRNSTDSGVSNNVCTINPTNFFRYCSFPELPADLGISGNITNEPVFGPALTLAAGSPGIDSGITLPGVAVDLTGALRPRDGNQDRQAVSDMGAYEYWDSRPRGSLLIIR